MINHKDDGIKHINIYSKGKTALGRFLSNFERTPITTPDGNFKSIEGYWYWLITRNEELRELYGFMAKKVGKESAKVAELDEDKIKKAIDKKLWAYRRFLYAQDLWYSDLPLEHYYVYGDKVVDAGYKWIIEHIEDRRMWFKANRRER